MTIRKVGGYGAGLGGNTFTGAQVAPSLAIGGATIGSNALAVTGTGAFSSYISTVGGVGNNGQSPASQGMQYSGSTTVLVAGGNGAIARLSDNSGHVYIEAITGVVTLGGATAAVSPQQMTLNVQNVLAGTSNTAGADLIFAGSQGTGNAAGGRILFKVAPAGSSGSAQNAVYTAIRIEQDTSITLLYGTGGACIAQIAGTSNGVRLANVIPLGWTPGDANAAASDTGLSRISAGIIGVGAGAAGNVAGGLQAATLALGGATIGSNALAVTGLAAIVGNSSVIGITTISGAASGNATATFRVFGGLSNSAGFQVTQNSATDASLILNTVAGGTLGIGSNNAAVLTFAATTNAVAISTSLALGGATIGSNALAVTGTGAFSGAVSLGNTVNSVSPTSPNRTVTMVIGGTTYYLAAKTTND